MKSNYSVHTVDSQNEKNNFHSLPAQIYVHYSNWIAAPHADIEALFDPHHPLLKRGHIQRWVVYKDQQPCGRIVAFTHSKLRVGSHKEVSGGIGFFECMDDTLAAELLFQVAETWLKDLGVEKVYGPIHPAEKDSYWGLLVEGFDRAPGFRKNFHADYYKKLFEQNGYIEEYHQYTYTRSLAKDAPEDILRRLEKNHRVDKYSFSSIRNIPTEEYQNHILNIYNESWGKIPGFKTLTPEQNRNNFKKLKTIMNKDLIWIAFHENKAVGFAIFMPEVAEHIKDFHGQWSWYHQLKLLFRLKMRPTKKVIGLGFGILPAHQGTGLAHLLVKTVGQYIRNEKKVSEIELNWIGSFNKKMMDLVESFEAVKSKTHVTFGKSMTQMTEAL